MSMGNSAAIMLRLLGNTSMLEDFKGLGLSTPFRMPKVDGLHAEEDMVVFEW